MAGSEWKATVLVVDDEKMVRNIAAQMLKKLDYNVMAASSGTEAIDIFHRNSEKIDLVILDMIMPGIDGAAVFDEIRKIDPSIKVILSSGYSRDSQAGEIMSRGCDAFIQKPFRMQEMSRLIETLVAEH